jgi:cyclic pyranopterin phosphate synthase
MGKEKGMVDVSAKDITVRTAKARGCVQLGAHAYRVLREGSCAKGDVFVTAKVAAIQAVKSTPAIVPMCHPLLVEGIEVEFEPNETEESVAVTVSVKASGKTGVEMEALCGVVTACLTIYDMLKYLSKAITIVGIKLIEKTGGKSGDYKRTD